MDKTGVAWGSSAGGTGLLSDSGIGDNGFPAPANEVIAWLDKAFPGGDLVHYEQDPECDDYNMEDYLEWEHPALDGVVGFVRGPGDSEFWLVEWSLIGESDSSWQLGGDLSWLSLGMTIEDASLQLEAYGRQVTQEWLSTEEGLMVRVVASAGPASSTLLTLEGVVQGGEQRARVDVIHGGTQLHVGDAECS